MFEQLLRKIDQLKQPSAETPPTPAIQPQIADFPFTPPAPIVSQHLYLNWYPPGTQIGLVPQVHVNQPVVQAGNWVQIKFPDGTVQYVQLM